jgi:uncharacterized protein YbjT (DUF2867 family)
MKIVVIGGSGLIGSRLVANLTNGEREVVAASPSTGVNTMTGDGLSEALAGADVVVDVTNSPSFEDTAVMNFFKTSTTNLLDAEMQAGVRHHVALSIVGTDRLQESGYFRAKLVQEDLIKAVQVPYTIVRATQFFEFVGGIADSWTQGDTVRVPPAFFQPMAADEVVDLVAEVAVRSPANGTIEIGGPEPLRMDELIRRVMSERNDAREVVTDADARYFGAPLEERTLVPGADAKLGVVRFEEWIKAGGSSAKRAGGTSE